MAAAFRVMLRMEIKPGLGGEFERVWTEIGDSVTAHPANLGQWLSRSDEDGVYYIVSDWVDEPRFREFETSERHLEHRQKLHPYRSGGSMTTMHVVAHLPGSAIAGSAEAGRAHADWAVSR
jgi:heme-degrading monooxygenase HmoA